MNNKWALSDFVFAGITGALIFAVAFLLGAGIILASGIPATGGIVNILVAVLLMAIAKHIKPKFGFAMLSLTITFAIAIPTIIGGTPGVYKIFVGFIIGLIFDLSIYLFRNSNKSYLLAGCLGAMTSIVSIFFAMKILGLPGIDQLTPLMKYLVPLQGVNGLLGAFLGNLIFNKRLKKLPAIKRIMQSND
jgi:ABC-type thiamin/hydroxymethylpyrimidine transport system permease subunit